MSVSNVQMRILRSTEVPCSPVPALKDFKEQVFQAKGLMVDNGSIQCPGAWQDQRGDTP